MHRAPCVNFRTTTRDCCSCFGRFFLRVLLERSGTVSGPHRGVKRKNRLFPAQSVSNQNTFVPHTHTDTRGKAQGVRGFVMALEIINDDPSSGPPRPDQTRICKQFAVKLHTHTQTNSSLLGKEELNRQSLVCICERKRSKKQLQIHISVNMCSGDVSP